MQDAQEDPDARAFVIVVVGYHELGTDGSHGISDICRAGVRRAKALAGQTRPRAVVFTGWSSTGGPSEAAQMAARWNGRNDVELICEPHAANTAENAVRTLEVAAGDDGAARRVHLTYNILRTPLLAMRNASPSDDAIHFR